MELNPKIKEPKEVLKEVKVQYTGRQYIIQLPIDFVDVMDIEKGDIFIIKVPLEDRSKYSIKLKKKLD